MISAYYQEIKLRLDSLQQVLPKNAKKAGWNIKQAFHSANGEPELIYSPCWFIEYNTGGKAYSVIVDVCSGCGKETLDSQGSKMEVGKNAKSD
jgi:hypothetical protein